MMPTYAPSSVKTLAGEKAMAGKNDELMEDWQLDFEWLRVQHYVKDAMRRDAVPDLNMVLMLIGIQELGRWKKVFTKEEKQDLMHIGVCSLLTVEGYFEFVGRDADGWPHYRQVRDLPPQQHTMAQERLLKVNAVRYFSEHLGGGSMVPEPPMEEET